MKTADPEKLRQFVTKAYEKAGLPSKDAELAAEMLLDADLRGIDSHGVFNLRGYYIKGLRDGSIKANPDIRVLRGSPTTASVEGDGGLGFLVAHRAMTEAIAMAEASGTGWVTAAGSNHCGAGAYYVLMAARRGMIGIHFSTGGTTVTGPGGRSRLIGNNVIAVAAPGGREGPFVLDMAPTMAIANKLHKLQWAGKPMPEGWAVDSRGKAITDPKRYFEEPGAILPLGSTADFGVHKGFGLLLVADIFSGLLSGDGGSMFRKKGRECHAFCALRVDAFPSAGEFPSLMDSMIEKIRSAPTAEGQPPMKYPGERGNRTFLERKKNGIPLLPEIAADLEALGRELGLDSDVIWKSEL